MKEWRVPALVGLVELSRLIMLAMDADPIAQHSGREHVLEQGMERMLPGRIS